MKKNNFFTIASLIIAIIAICISYGAYEKVERANEITVIGKRPALNIKAIRFEENGSYMLAREKDEALEIMIQFEIYNAGEITAENVTFPSSALFVNLKDNSENLIPTENILDIYDLAPGTKRTFPFLIRLEWPTENMRKILDSLNRIANDEFPFSIQLPISYLNALDGPQETKIDSRFRFTKNVVYVDKFDIIFPDKELKHKFMFTKILIIIDTYLKLILTSWPAVILILFILLLFRHREVIDGLIKRIIKITREGLYFGGPSGSEPMVPQKVSESQKTPIKPESHTPEHGVARVSYQITHTLPNSIQFDFAKDYKVWFWIFNYDPRKYLAYIKIRFIADGIKKESTSDYYGGTKPWKLNAYSGIQAPGLSFPEEIKNAVKQNKEIKIEIQCKIYDEFNAFIEEKLPQIYVYNPKDNSWFLEP